MAPTMKENKEDNSRDERILAAVGFAVALLGLGLPLWWKTTEVYRVPLPSEEMEEVGLQSVRFPITVEVVAQDSIPHETMEKKLADTFGEGLFELRMTQRFPTKEETREIESTIDLENFDSTRKSTVKEGNFCFLQVPSRFMSKNKKVVIGQARTAYFSGKPDVEVLLRVLSQQLLREKNFPYGRNASELCSFSANTKAKLFQVPPAASYDLLFTLAIPDPTTFAVNWDIGDAVERYVSPLLNWLRPWASFRVRSQVLYLSSLGGQTQWREELGVNVLPWEQLPLLATPLEARLASHVHAHPRLNFLLCIAPCSRSPLLILDRTQQVVPSNAFVLPQWGGVQVLNLPCPPSSSTNSSISMQTMMGVLLSQLRLLLGLTEEESIENPEVLFLPLHGSAIREWEKDHLLRVRAAQNLCSVGISLKSLAQLLGEISGIVINEEVGGRIHRALGSSKLARKSIEKGELERGQQAAQEAFVAAEGAFHDPSLLALLYFPEDQKYAIYIPLFLPVGIPVALSLQSIFVWATRKWKKAKQD